MSMMDWTGVDFTGLANLNLGDLRDSQGRFPMDPGYDPTLTNSPVSRPLVPNEDADGYQATPTETDQDKATRLANEREDAQAKEAEAQTQRCTINHEPC
jgi:hypothetical protein